MIEVINDKSGIENPESKIELCHVQSKKGRLSI